MRAAVDDGFAVFSEHFEGVVRTPYADILGLITVAIGDLIDPIESALSLPFHVRGTNTPATREQIAAAWHAIKNDPKCPKLGWRYAAALPGNQVELSDDGIKEVVERKLQQNEAALANRFPDWAEWPADAQLATHSMAWACGSAFRFPRLSAALLARDFATAAKECHIDTDGPDHIPNTGDDNNGVKPRNAANGILYSNADKVQTFGLDPEPVYYPEQLVAPPPDASPASSTRIIHPETDLAGLAQSRP